MFLLLSSMVAPALCISPPCSTVEFLSLAIAIKLISTSLTV